VGGDEVDAVVGASVAVLVEVAGAGQPRGQRADHVRIAPPEPPQIVAIATVPFGPAQVGERAHLVGPDRVPGLGDDLGIGQQRVFGNGLDHGRIGDQFALPVAAEDRR
jgi:hypothetical protein